MFKKIVVPLDGSKLAEVVLPELEKLAGQVGEVVLVSVTEKLQGRVSGMQALETGPEHNSNAGPMIINTGTATPVLAEVPYQVKEVTMNMGKMAKTAYNYLEKIANGLDKKGFQVSIMVLVGNPGEAIVSFADGEKADAIMIASRGKSGFSRWDLGNIAEKVVRAAKATVILVKPPADFKETKPKRKGQAI